jgi:hypothetical protein
LFITVVSVAKSVESSAAVGVADAEPAGVAVAVAAVVVVFAAVEVGVAVLLELPPHAADKARRPTNAPPRRTSTFRM